MVKRNLLFCCALLLFVAFVAESKRQFNGRKRSNSEPFDLLIFTQRWPQTVCYLWKEHSPKNACTLPQDEEWTIHGIWPTQYKKIGPQFCNSSLPFNATALKPLEKDLIEKWIDIEHGKDPYSFWRHEWNKHGTCAAVLEKFNSEVKYFRAGLALLDTYDMTHILAKANIIPGNKYTVNNIFKAINTLLGKTVEVECAKNQKSNESYIFEIRICFDKSLELIDCDGVSGYPTNCKHTEEITYPGIVPHRYHVIQV